MINTNMWYDIVVMVLGFVSIIAWSLNLLMATLTSGSYVGIDTHGSIWIKKEV